MDSPAARHRAALRWAFGRRRHSGGHPRGPQYALERAHALVAQFDAHYDAAKGLLGDCEEMRSLGRVRDGLQGHFAGMTDVAALAREVEQAFPPDATL